jgi:hypothetical protein
MLSSTSTANTEQALGIDSWLRSVPDKDDIHARGVDPPDILDVALDLIAAERYEAADRVLTGALLEQARRADLWLAAGIARLRRGAVRSAAAAFEMAVWIEGDPLARDLLAAIDI